MPRENPDFRDNLELLNSIYPGAALLNTEQVLKATGWKSARTIRRNLPTVNGRVSKVALAKYMCGGGAKNSSV